MQKTSDFALTRKPPHDATAANAARAMTAPSLGTTPTAPLALVALALAPLPVFVADPAAPVARDPETDAVGDAVLAAAYRFWLW